MSDKTDIFSTEEERQARIGYATTRLLIDEIRSRAEVDHTIGNLVDDEIETINIALDELENHMDLDYRTVDHE